jgi:hypothetical protein
MKIPQFLLVVDDAVVLVIISIIGITFHQTDPSLFARLPYTLLPFLGAWVFFAATLQMYDPAVASAWNQLWRVLVAAALTAAIGASLRALWLGIPIAPIFVVVMGLAITLGILLSRSIFILIFGRRWTGPGNG